MDPTVRALLTVSQPILKQHVLGAILFENTMDREIQGKPTAAFLWEEKGIVPFLKCDKGLAPENQGVQVMKPMPGLDDLLARAVKKGIFGTKMRSYINAANAGGIKEVVKQQFEVGKQIIGHGLCPIIEPEVDIHSPDKEKSEEFLKAEILAQLDNLADDQKVMLKVSLPSKDDFYKELVDHPKVIRVVALSGGYSRDNANAILSRQNGMIASFSRALTENLSADQSQQDFDKKLKDTVVSIYEASKAP